MDCNILFIPHSPRHHFLKIRGIEFARSYAEINSKDVYVLDYQLTDLQKSPELNHENFTINKFKSLIKIYKLNGVTFIQCPIIEHPYYERGKLNKFLIRQVIKLFNIKIVYNASFDLISIPANILEDIFYIFDIIDDHGELAYGERQEHIFNFMENECDKADLVIAVSKILAKRYSEKFWIKIMNLPNGYRPLKRTEEKMLKNNSELRNKYNLNNAKIITCIGNHNVHSGLKLLIDAINSLSKEYHIKLVLVGMGHDYDLICESENVIKAGRINNDEIYKFFDLSDIGAVPLITNRFTNEKFPIKLIEYGASKKIVIASPISEIQRYNLPYIIITPNKVESWAESIKWALEFKWGDAWTSTIHKFNWNQIASIFDRTIRNHTKFKKINKINN